MKGFKIIELIVWALGGPKLHTGRQTDTHCTFVCECVCLRLSVCLSVWACLASLNNYHAKLAPSFRNYRITYHVERGHRSQIAPIDSLRSLCSILGNCKHCLWHRMFYTLRPPIFWSGVCVLLLVRLFKLFCISKMMIIFVMRLVRVFRGAKTVNTNSWRTCNKLAGSKMPAW